jgi:hypothetical protein
MIKYEWRTQLDSGEAAQLADLLERAAAYDAEPEYTTIDFRDVERTLTDSRVRHLLIWMLPRRPGAPGADRRSAAAGGRA